VQQHELRPPRGAKKQRKRVGRGNASGHGTYSGKGIKGQQARSGSGLRLGFEGGQTPLIRRLPRRRGFHNPFRIEFTPVSLRAISRLPAGAEVTPEALHDAGIVRSLRRPIKVLADGELEAALTVRAHRVSAAARAKIEGAGGTVEELMPRPQPEEKRRRRKGKKAEATVAEEAAGTEDAAAAAQPADEEADGNNSETSESTGGSG